MGLLWSLLAPRSMKRARRAAHPVRNVRRAVTPRPVRRVRYRAWQARHPLQAAAEGVVRSARRRRRRRR